MEEAQIVACTLGTLAGFCGFMSTYPENSERAVKAWLAACVILGAMPLAWCFKVLFL